MKQEKLEFTYSVFDNINELNDTDEWLLSEAREMTKQAYAPYSNFHVGAVAKLANGEVVHGTNQENASFPAGTCAERVLLGTAATMYPGVPIEMMAISYEGKNGKNNEPLSPCGVCRQYLHEYEQRVKQPIRVIFGGMSGPVIILNKASDLLPMAFTGKALK